MSVIAGAALFNGALVGADSRISWCRRGKIERVADNGLKVLPLAQRSVIAFVADDIREAARLLKRLERDFPGKAHTDPYSLLHWLPRFFSYWYRESQFRGKLGFIVGATAFGRATKVPRKHLLSLLDGIVHSTSAVRTWLPDILVQALRTPAEVDPVAIRCGGEPVLFSCCSPGFEPVLAKPLEVIAIGSGERAKEELVRCQDAIVGFPENPFMAAWHLREALRRYAEEKQLPDVGGSFPIFETSVRGLIPHAIRTEMPLGGNRLSLTFNGKTWVQQNETTGRTLPLVPPWDLPQQVPSDQRFDDWNEAWEAFRRPR